MQRRLAPLHPSPSVPSWWPALFEASGSDSIFLSAAWLQAWIARYGPSFDGTWVHWEVDGVVVGGCLLVERTVRVKRIPFHSLYVNATGDAGERSPFAEFNDVLHLPGHGAAVAADFARLLQQRSWSRLLLNGHQRQGVMADALQALHDPYTEQVGEPSHYVDLAALGERPFAAALAGKAGTWVRRNQREFEQRLGPIRLRRAADLDETLAFFEQMRAMHLARFGEPGKSSSLSYEGVVDFHRRLIAALFARGEVDMLRVGSESHAIGYLYTFVVRGKVSLFQSGFAYEPSSKWSPGLLTHALAIEHYRERGLREYDFLAGDALYKRTLANRARELVWTTLYRDRPWIRLLLAGRRLRDRLARPPALSAAD